MCYSILVLNKYFPLCNDCMSCKSNFFFVFLTSFYNVTWNWIYGLLSIGQEGISPILNTQF